LKLIGIEMHKLVDVRQHEQNNANNAMKECDTYEEEEEDDEENGILSGSHSRYQLWWLLHQDS
jgi:hypothetical protein